MARHDRKPVFSQTAARNDRRSTTVRLTAGMLAAIMVGGIIVGIVSSQTDGGEAGTDPVVPVATSCPAADGSDGPRIDFTGRPSFCLSSSTVYTAVFDTTEGQIRFTLDAERTPETVNNFVVLSRFGYYDDTALFRFDPTIAIIQGGSPHTQDWSDPGPGYTIPDEGGVFMPLANGGMRGPFTYVPGQIVMARSAGPNSSGAQFFLTTGDAVSLLDSQGSYIVFGHTDDAGLAALQAMMDLYVADEASEYGGGPSRPVTVNSVTIVETPAGS